METLGIEIPPDTLGNLPYDEDKCHMWYDGPLIWETKDKEGRPLLFYWVMDEKHENFIIDRYLIIPTTSQLLNSMLSSKITIQFFVGASSSTVYIQDTIYRRNCDPESTLYKIDLKDVPKDYLPVDGVTFNP